MSNEEKDTRLDTIWPGNGFWRGFFGFYYPPLLHGPHMFTRRFWQELRGR